MNELKRIIKNFTKDAPYDNERVKQQAIKKAQDIFKYIEGKTGIRAKGNARFYQQVDDWLDDHWEDPKYKQVAQKIDKQLDLLKELLSGNASDMLHGLNPGKFYKRYVKRHLHKYNPKHELNRHGNERKAVSNTWKNYEDL